VPLRLDQTAFGAGELSPSIEKRHDLEKWDVGLKQAKNVYILKQGGFIKRPGLQFIAETKDSSAAARLIEFEFKTTQTYVLEFGNLYMRVVKDNGLVLTGSAKTITGATRADPVVITTSGAHGLSNGTEVYITGIVGMTELNGRNFRIANVASTTFELQDMYSANLDGSAFTTWVSGGTADTIFEVTTPYLTADLSALDYVQSADTMYIVHPDHAPRKLTRTGHAAWTLTTVSFVPTQAAPTAPSAVATVGAGAITYSYVITAISDTTGEESLPTSAATCTNDLSTSGNYNTVSWTGAAGADRNRVYKLENGVHRYIGFTTAVTFDDENIDPDDNDTPPEATALFGGAGKYPAAVSFYEQRLTLGGSDDEPQTLWLGRSEALENFSVSVISQANDAITLRLFGQQVNEIRHLVELNELFILTSGSERSLRGNDGFITPTNGLRSNISFRGGKKVKPFVVGDSILFVQDAGETIYEKTFQGFDGQGRSRYAERELTIMAEHLLRGRTCDDWSFAQAPDSLVMLATSDATGLYLTYHREHDIWALTQCLPGGSGQIESVASIRDGSYDAHYAIVKRTINGVTKRYIERQSDRYITDITDAFYVDSGLTYDGAATTTITGLHHLEGSSVVALADGAVLPAMTVALGAVTLPAAAEKVHVGLSYQALAQTLPPHIATRGGSSQGRRKRIAGITLGVRNALGVKVGPSEAEARHIIPRNVAGVAPMIDVGDYEMPNSPKWGREVTLFIVSDDPLPMEITHITPDVTLGG